MSRAGNSDAPAAPAAPARKACVVTGSRAEYGLLRWVMEGVRGDPRLSLQVAVTGMHLSPEYGYTARVIEEDGFEIDSRVEMLLGSDTPVALGKSLGLGVMGFADAFAGLKPDLVVVLGDRFEILAAVCAALLASIPVAHIHGGETTEGAYDEAIRHSITKMSHLHFVAAAEYRNRVIQLGEHPDRVFLVGGLGVDAINRAQLMDRRSLERSLGFDLGDKSLLITFHPVTLEAGSSDRQSLELLAALAPLSDTRLIFTMPNADAGSRGVWRLVEEFVARHPNARAVTSLGQERYWSCVSHVDGVVGNSSSGLVEVPTFRKGTVNVGDRQHGRLKAASVIDCAAERSAISAAIRRLYSTEFQRALPGVCNPYGEGGASESIVRTIAEHGLDGLVKKRFYDLPVSAAGVEAGVA